MEELFHPVDPNDRYKGENSSVSSWSASMSGLGKDLNNRPNVRYLEKANQLIEDYVEHLGIHSDRW